MNVRNVLCRKQIIHALAYGGFIDLDDALHIHQACHSIYIEEK